MLLFEDFVKFDFKLIRSVVEIIVKIARFCIALGSFLLIWIIT